MSDYLTQIHSGILDGNMEAVRSLVQQALADGLSPAGILQQGMIPAMAEVGRLFEDGEFYVPEMLISARAMQSGLEILKPLLASTGVQPAGRVVIGTVKGDMHDIGKNLVSMMLEGAGFEMKDLGTDVSPERFVEAVKELHPDILAMSALLTTTMSQMGVVVQALEEAGVRDQVKVIVGGAPVTESYARQIRADGYAPDAGRAASLAKQFAPVR
jgi:5-methyltetrahydrofolate--homocysteine methyltransferase